MKKKILITQSSLNTGGIEKVVTNLLSNIDYNKYSVDLAVLDNKGYFLKFIPKEVKIINIREEHRQLSNNTKLIYKHTNKFIRNTIRVFNQYDKYCKKLFNNEKTEYDVAIAFNGYNDECDYYAAFSNSKKKLIWVHSDYKRRAELDNKFRLKLTHLKPKYKYFDKVVAVSESAAIAFREVFPECINKTEYLFNLVENKVVIDKEDYKLKDGYNVINICRMVKQKGLERFVSVASKNKDLNFYIIGDGPFMEKTKKMIEKKNINNITLTGMQNNIYSILKQADLFLMTSHLEGFPGVLMESLIAGLPIVAPDVSGARDIFKYVAPKEKIILTEDSTEGLIKGMAKAINKKMQKGYDFNYEEYNREIIKKFYSLIE